MLCAFRTRVPECPFLHCTTREFIFRLATFAWRTPQFLEWVKEGGRVVRQTQLNEDLVNKGEATERHGSNSVVSNDALWANFIQGQVVNKKQKFELVFWVPTNCKFWRRRALYHSVVSEVVFKDINVAKPG